MIVRPYLVIGAVALAAALSAGAARADHKPLPRDPSAIEAVQRYDTGMRLYNLADWSGALDEFKRAYLIKADPAFLFNIGQCHRQLAHYHDAVNSYRAFLREAHTVTEAQREQVRALIAQMEQAIREARAAEPPTGTAPPAGTMAGAAPAESVRRSSGLEVKAVSAPSRTAMYKKWWLWTAVGAAAALGVGLGVGLGTRGTSYPSAPADISLRF